MRGSYEELDFMRDSLQRLDSMRGSLESRILCEAA